MSGEKNNEKAPMEEQSLELSEEQLNEASGGYGFVEPTKVVINHEEQFDIADLLKNTDNVEDVDTKEMKLGDVLKKE